MEEERLRELFRETGIPQAPLPVGTYFDFLIDVVLRHSTNMGSPRCLGHMTGGLPALMRPLGNLLLGLNQNLVKGEAAATLGPLERQTLAMLHRLVYGFTEGFYQDHAQRNGSTLGVVTTGGTLANVTALWCARNAAFPATKGFAGIEVAGLPAALRAHGCERAVIVGSRLMHYSIEKAAGVLGLGSEGVLQVPVDGASRIRMRALEDTVARCRERGWRILALVGVAGTTDCGSIDPLDEMAELAAREGIHFHVDAAWGAPLLFSDAHRHRLAGMERADTVTIDGHKQLYLPIGISMLLFRDPHAARVVEKQAAYMLRQDSSDLGKVSLEGSRAGMVLFAHSALHVLGREGYRDLIDGNLRKARRLGELIAASDEFELLSPPETNIVLYRHLSRRAREACPEARATPDETARLNAHNEAVQRQQHAAGRSFVSRTTVTHLSRYPGLPVVAMRAVVVNPSTEEADLREVLADQAAIAARLDS
jgi:glutamate decarboxylase